MKKVEMPRIEYFGLDVLAYVNRIPKIFTGFIVRSIINRLSQGSLKEALRKAHEMKAPCEIYCTPFQRPKGRARIYAKEGSDYLFSIYSFSHDLLEFVKGILEEGSEISHKDYSVQILGINYYKGKVNETIPRKSIEIEFISPSSFRYPPLWGKGGSYFPFPRADLIVKSALRTLKVNFGVSLETDPRKFTIEDFSKLKSFTLRDFLGRPYVSFMGKVKIKEEEEGRALGIVASISEISGLGAWRESGFGRVSLHDRNENKRRKRRA